MDFCRVTETAFATNLPQLAQPSALTPLAHLQRMQWRTPLRNRQGGATAPARLACALAAGGMPQAGYSTAFYNCWSLIFWGVNLARLALCLGMVDFCYNLAHLSYFVTLISCQWVSIRKSAHSTRSRATRGAVSASHPYLTGLWTE